MLNWRSLPIRIRTWVMTFRYIICYLFSIQHYIYEDFLQGCLDTPYQAPKKLTPLRRSLCNKHPSMFLWQSNLGVTSFQDSPALKFPAPSLRLWRFWRHPTKYCRIFLISLLAMMGLSESKNHSTVTLFTNSTQLNQIDVSRTVNCGGKKKKNNNNKWNIINIK